MIKPQRLLPGDRIALVAPASAFNPDALAAGVRELHGLGFDAVYDERVFERGRFVAGTAQARAALITDAWNDPSIKGIIAIRGGYGSAHLLPLLDPTLMTHARKVFVGYSDNTAILGLHLRHGLVCFHGPMIEGRLARGEDGYDRQSFVSAVSRAEPLGELTPPGLEALKAGEVRGPLVGGTLTQIASLLGTPWAFELPAGCILFLEDVAERPYRVDRLLTQLSQAGLLARAAGIVFGEFPKCDEPGGNHAIKDVLREFTTHFPGPVLFGFPSGHTTGPTWTLPFGVKAVARATTKPALLIEESSVE